jgi:hypothetical protein
LQSDLTLLHHWEILLIDVRPNEGWQRTCSLDWTKEMPPDKIGENVKENPKNFPETTD